MMGHGYALAFLARVYGDVAERRARDPIKRSLSRAVRFSAEAQSTQGGWFATSRVEGHDRSNPAVTVIMLDGLRGARNMGIAVPNEVRQKGRDYVKNTLAQEQLKDADTGTRLVVHRPVLTAAALEVVFDEHEFKEPLKKRWLKYCRRAIPFGGRPRVDGDEFLHYYYAPLVYRLGDEGWKRMFPESGDDEQLTWSAYRSARFDFLKRTQAKDGSWEDTSFGFGRVFATAMHLTVLQLDNTPLSLSR
jgi:hypothetical protein